MSIEDEILICWEYELDIAGQSRLTRLMREITGTYSRGLHGEKLDFLFGGSGEREGGCSFRGWGSGERY